MLFSLFYKIRCSDEAYFNEEGRLIFPEPKFVPEYSNTQRQVLDEEWKNIRIKLNMSYITGELRDPNACYEEGQILNFNNQKVTCEKNMLLSNTDLTNFTKTLNHFKEFQESFLKVLPSPNKDYDMEIIIKIIRYSGSGDTVLASRDTYNEYSRTTRTTMIFNHAKLPSEPSIWETDSENYVGEMMRQFFRSLDIIHARYHPKNSTKPYPDEKVYCSFTKYGRKYNFLIAPYSHLFAQKHYGVDVFEGDDKSCPSGIEIQFDGVRGTNYNFIKGRLFNTDLSTQYYLQSGTNTKLRITDATMAIIQDTGNYICNWSMGKPLVWGNPESQIGGKPINDFAIGPPQLVFPEIYYYYPNNYMDNLNRDRPEYVGFDFKFGGDTGASSAPTTCSYYEKDYCDAPQFYNPLNKTSYFYLSSFDFLPIKYPSIKCKDGEAMIPGDSVCHQYICDKYDNFTLITPDYGDINSQLTNIICAKKMQIRILQSNFLYILTNIKMLHVQIQSCSAEQ